MGLDFSRVTPPEAPKTEQAPAKNEIETVQPYDIAADRQQMNETLVNSAEVDALVSTIEVNNLETIVSFGAEAAEEISKASDVVLNSMNMGQLEESSEMLSALSKIWTSIIPWVVKLIRSMFSLNSMKERSVSPTRDWSRCLR